MRKGAALLCLLCLIFIVPRQEVRAAETTAETNIQQLINYYRHYQQDAAGDIQRVLTQMNEEVPEEAARWGMIIESWRWINEQMPVNTGVLPDGLAEDDSLCIVVMGFKLESSGAMKPELIHRLETALASAQKYPNSILVCTGGATSQRSDITEAGEMKKWLVEKGVEENRIITETRAANTPQNAVFVYQLLQSSFPNVSQIAVITSDYHIYRSMILFFAEAVLNDLPYHVVANAVCTTERAGEHELEKQAKNLAELAGITLSDAAPELLVPKQAPETHPPETIAQTREPTTETLPPTVPETSILETTQAPAIPESEQKVPFFALAAFVGALSLALILLMILIRICHPKTKR